MTHCPLGAVVCINPLDTCLVEGTLRGKGGAAVFTPVVGEGHPRAHAVNLSVSAGGPHS